MVGKGKLDEMIAKQPHVYECGGGMGNLSLSYENRSLNLWANYWAENCTLIDMIPAEEIIWLEKPQTQLADNEIIVSLSNFSIYSDSNDPTEGEKLLNDLQNGKTDLTADSFKAVLDTLSGGKWVLYNGYEDEWGNYQHTEDNTAKIVGIVRPDSDYRNACVIPQKFFSIMVKNPDGIYDSALSAMPQDRAGIEQIVRYCYRDGKDITERYEMNNAVVTELDTVNTALKALAKVFFWIGLFFALFAALLMANFISTSIHYKRQEIGILRAIGSRSADVFRIFFSESFLIAAINFVWSAIACSAAVLLINYIVRWKLGVLITALHFGIRQIALLILGFPLWFPLLIAAAAVLFVNSFHLRVCEVGFCHAIDGRRIQQLLGLIGVKYVAQGFVNVTVDSH